ncbi:hypothetical protein [Allorhizobium terrae]|uniref:DUF3829 domain-containing protein n=1 Tax=Allorhizobium terrae TaxID=1848972 RepID=A0A4V3W7L4_9HYPH|nr:hypothetical protein [Allorhizobium terrae]THF47771.1 hypothetical protein E6C51_17030 [Allorhizobium terrae]
MISGLKRDMRAALLCLGIGTLSPVAACADPSIDASLVQIEQVREHVSNVGLLAESASKYISDQEGSHDKQANSMIESATRDAFNAQAFVTDIQNSMQNVGNSSIDAQRLAKVADDLTASRKKIETLAQSKGDTALQSMGAEIVKKADSPRIEQLTQVMASPELAAETAVTAQAMYAAVHAFFNTDQSQFTALSQEQRRDMPKQILSYLQQKTENEKPYSKDAERANEKLRLALALAGLPDEDVVFLSDLYQSPEGEAKRAALVGRYKRLSAEANQKMLREYFTQLADNLTKNKSNN